MRFLRRSLVGVFLLSLTLALFVAAGWTVLGALRTVWNEEAPVREARERVFAVNVLTVTPQTLTPVLTTYGQIESRRTLELRAGTSGRVVELHEDFQEGGAVAAGETVARIDPVTAEAALAVARADVAEAEADLRDAERGVDLVGEDLASVTAQAELRTRALERQRDLDARGVGTASAVEEAELAAASADQAVVARRQSLAQAEARLDLARIELERRRIALAEAERSLEDTEIVAGFSGVLTDVAAVEGGLVAANEQLARLVDSDALEVAFRLSAPQYARLLSAEGDLRRLPVVASLDVMGVDVTARGEITRESAVVGEGQTGRRVFARLESAEGFRPGDFVTVSIEEPPLDEVALLPAAAVDSANTVLTVTADERLELADVELLRRQGDDVIVRAAGLAGAEVVAERVPMLGPGISVRPNRADGTAAEARAEMLELSDERRARLVAFVEGQSGMPDRAKERVLAQLREPQVPAQVVERIEQRMGG
ncbi:efflux RND transporter periplasmic adaptor subunit [Roseitranquillus sediminis]|uniref:efflux RND transporter periplasmic adaptor subunit n=1 Tax=Roseitranquillus sediminis TaxID=2809051 RepID=UPI001D0C1D55|nr:HlyD family efflux transporter periplasmic adaptor subunit [Roseitranquillus sediminis]MBM9593339.1 HlyD family efflux transporter periplasmic adaptor subunit [Roseitranquillus sediminis]